MFHNDQTLWLQRAEQWSVVSCIRPFKFHLILKSKNNKHSWSSQVQTIAIITNNYSRSQITWDNMTTAEAPVTYGHRTNHIVWRGSPQEGINQSSLLDHIRYCEDMIRTIYLRGPEINCIGWSTIPRWSCFNVIIKVKRVLQAWCNSSQYVVRFIPSTSHDTGGVKLKGVNCQGV